MPLLSSVASVRRPVEEEGEREREREGEKEGEKEVRMKQLNRVCLLPLPLQRSGRAVAPLRQWRGHGGVQWSGGGGRLVDVVQQHCKAHTRLHHPLQHTRHVAALVHLTNEWP